MRWSIYQLLTFSLIVLFMWFLEYINQNGTNPHSSGEWTAVNSTYMTFITVSLAITLFYLIFLFEAKKDNSLLDRSLWKVMPTICIVAGIVSVILFLIGGIFGPIMEWVEQWRSLLYVFMIYFLFLIFLFIFSIEHKNNRFKQRNEKTVHIAFIWTIVLFIVLYFLF
ncbi:hypothetical protein [Alkalibacillus almallahensis]|uniref:hypothetical protein n=1 Tax=Alkalibacillus almallahensis TaxID=1379154 RepID=UPI001423D5FE|nr:hypothetical protein [Alkalibacillus almallahensis]NIK12583.1 O-antigen/teichoic acid export membrane protein [Alkalibacillus almallahensis]